ncbi:entericidin [Rhizobium mayense]|uniref:entericidin n=1 Tax=Rhizobium mayense TaxID=1312184 RepID=UPI00398C2A85
MRKVSVAVIMMACLALSSCANTFHGMRKDAAETGNALDASGHKVLKAGSSGNKAAN